MRTAKVAQVRRGQLGKVRLAGRAELAGRNSVIREWFSRGWIPRNRRRTGAGGAISDIVKVPLKSRRRGEPRLPHLAPALLVPLLREEEEGLVLIDRTAYGVAVVVAAQIILFPANRVSRSAVLLLLPQKVV